MCCKNGEGQGSRVPTQHFDCCSCRWRMLRLYGEKTKAWVLGLKFACRDVGSKLIASFCSS